MNNKIFIIAEAGVNHNGNINTAFEMIDVAKMSGSDAIKFQTSVPELVMTGYAKKANYQIQSRKENETQLTMAKRLQLPMAAYKKLKLASENSGIEFLSTPFDDSSIDQLQRLDMKKFKIPSGEITNLPYLRHVAQMGKPIIMSTGMASIDEVQAAFNVLLESGLEKDKITILHCNTEYPTPIEDVNLNAMFTIRDKLGVKVGYSDHTLGIEIPIAAAAIGATVIEKHFTLSREMEGPDHRASLEPDELKAMVAAIRNIEKAMGDGVKKPSKSEMKNILIARKSIVAKKPIRKGESFTEDNLTVKRPGSGISPMEWDEILGKTADRVYEEDELIEN